MAVSNSISVDRDQISDPSFIQEEFSRIAYAAQHRHFDGKICWLNGDPSPHWQEEFVPSCLTWNKDDLVVTLLDSRIESLPGWTGIVEFTVSFKGKPLPFIGASS